MLDVIRWNNLMAKLGLAPKSNDPFDRLIEAYAEPHRHYHTAGHIAHCLREFDASRHLAAHPDEVEFALWLHDGSRGRTEISCQNDEAIYIFNPRKLPYKLIFGPKIDL